MFHSLRPPAAFWSRLLLLFGLVGALGTAPALAQTCPSGAYTGSADLPDGTSVEILAVHSQDAFYSQRSDIEGLTGRVSGDLHKNDGCWYGGGFIDASGEDYYFYKVAIRTTSGGGSASSGGSASCPPGAVGSNLPDGRRVRVIAVHPEDAYYSSASDVIGTTGRVSGDLHSNGGCWLGGGFVADDGSDYYFYKAAFKDLGGGETAKPTGDTQGCPPGASTASGFDDGQRVKIVGLSPEDAYHDQAADIIGLTGQVKDELHNNGGCWMGGGFTADDGSYYYFYKAAVKPLSSGSAQKPTASGPSCPSGAVTSNLSEGTRVRIAGLHPDDAFYSDRSSVIGLTGRVDGDLHVNDGCWLGGGFVTDEGQEYYFYKAAVTRVGGGGGGSAEAGGRYAGPSVASGQQLRIVAVSPDDAYHGDRADIIGKTCTADEELEEMEDGWYAGSVSCSDGSSYYFYKVGVSLQ